MSSYVYALFRPDNGKVFYIGATSSERRLKEHLASRRGPKAQLIRALLDVLGYKDIPFVVIRDSLTARKAAELETIFIDALGRVPNGPLLNVHRFSGVLDDEIRKVMSAKAKARDPAGRVTRLGDPEVRAKIAEAKRGKPSGKKGKHYGPYERGKIAQGQLGWITNGVEETRVNKTAIIPDGWRRGRLLVISPEELERRAEAQKVKREAWLKRNREFVWITNGQKDLRISPSNSLPDGWRQGRATAGPYLNG